MSPKTILIVDDDMSVLETLDFILTSDGYTVFLAANGEDGLDIIKSEWIDCIILDLRMPKVSGYLFANLAINNSKNKDVKIILLTGESLMAGQCKVDVANVSHKITKPFDLDELRKSLADLVKT
ncbi:MAG: response regulator [Candidatus Margulisiibacteriota bacterium]|nr:response regulator [Candidatus Margulisiibacteriota bacterium]